MFVQRAIRCANSNTKMRRRNCSTKTADLHHKSPQTDAPRPFQYLFIEKITMFTTKNKSHELYDLDFRLT